MSSQNTNCCANTTFISPVTGTEVECMTKNLKDTFSAGYDQIPECLVKQCTDFIKKRLSHIYNASFESGIFLDRLKMAKLKLLYEKRGYS